MTERALAELAAFYRLSLYIHPYDPNFDLEIVIARKPKQSRLHYEIATHLAGARNDHVGTVSVAKLGLGYRMVLDDVKPFNSPTNRRRIMGPRVPYPKHGSRPGFMPPRLHWNAFDSDEKEEDYYEEG